MGIALYSTILSVLILLLGIATVVSVVGYIISPAIRRRVKIISYDTWLKLIGFFATIATLGSLTYQLVYAAPVCSLCWWQRIFMFPIEIVIIVSLWTKAKTNHYITAVMACIGIVFSAKHYYAHFQKYVAGNPFFIPCSVAPGEPSCSNAPIVSFGFITIPFMAFITFLAIIWLSYLAYQKSRSVSTVNEKNIS